MRHKNKIIKQTNEKQRTNKTEKQQQTLVQPSPTESLKYRPKRKNTNNIIEQSKQKHEIT